MDQTCDLSGRELYRLSQLLDAPEFVKEAEAGDLAGAADLPPDVFADPIHRLYPCHTPAAAWVSTAFFLDKKAQLDQRDVPYIQDRLDWYANYHGIGNSIKELREKHAAAMSVTESPLDDDDYALVYRHQDGELIRRYPMRNSAEVKTAASYLHTYRDRFPYNIRQEWAEKVFRKSAEHAANLGEHADYIERQAGYGMCTAKTASAMLHDRVNASRKDPGKLSEIQKGLLDLAEKVATNPDQLHAPGMLVKLAGIVDSFDRETGIWRHYGDEFKRPEDVLFEFTGEKMASAIQEHVATTTGNIYHRSDLEKLSADHVRLYMGNDFTDEVFKLTGKMDVEKAAELIPTLDRGLALDFDTMMQAAALGPVAKEAGLAVGFSRDYLMKMAEDYQQAGGIPDMG